MPTISAVIKYATNLDELRRELKAGTDQLVVLEKAAERTTRNLGGEGLMRAAHNAAAAIENLGGVTKLTAAEQERIHSLLGRAIEKYGALGQAAPSALKSIYDATTKIEQPTSRLTGFVNDLGKQIVGTAAGFLTAQAAIGGVRTVIHGVTEFIGQSIEAFSKQETAVKRMTTALQAQGQATPAVITQYKALASEFQNTTVFSDELINEMQALLVQVGDVMPNQMDAALKASTDLASGLGIDLRTATLLVGKAFEGETGTLKRYGIVIDEAKLKTEGVTAVMDAIQQKFGGQAQAEIETYAGKLKQMANAWDEVKESIGAVIVQDPALEALLRTAKESLVQVNETTGKEHQTTLLEWWNTLAGGGIAGDIAVAAIEHLSTIANLTATINRQMAQMGKAAKQPALFQGGAEAIPGADMEAVRKEWDAQVEAEKRAIEADKQHAAAVRELAAAYSGIKSIQAANIALEAVNQNLQKGIEISEMTEEQQLALNRSVTAAIDVYKAWGRTTEQIPPSLIKIQKETQKLIDVQEDAKRSLEDWSEAVRQHNEDYKRGEAETVAFLEQMEQERIDAAKAALDDYAEVVKRHQEEQKQGEADTNRVLEELDRKRQARIRETSADLNNIAQTLGVVGAAFHSLFGEIVSGAGAAVKGINDIYTATQNLDKLGQITATIDLGVSIGEKLRPLLGLRHGKLGELLGTNASGRQAIIDFAVEVTGTKDLDQLHKYLQQTLGADAEQFWILLSQGTGRANVEQALANIQKVKDAIKNAPASMADQAAAAGFKTTDDLKRVASEAVKLWVYMRDSGLYTAEAVQAAWERANEALIASGDAQYAATQRARDAITELDAKIKGLNDSIANEAPEEVMGVVEANARAQIAALEAEREAAQSAIDQTAESSGDAAEEAARRIDEELAQHEFKAKLRFDVEWPEPPDYITGRMPPGVSTGGYVTPVGIQRFSGGGIVEDAEHMAAGKWVRFAPQGTDTQPAVLTPGEGVINTRGMDLLGPAGLSALNAGTLPRLASPETIARPLQVTTILEMDKREFARAMVDVFPGEARRRGVRVRSS